MNNSHDANSGHAGQDHEAEHDVANISVFAVNIDQRRGNPEELHVISKVPNPANALLPHFPRMEVVDEEKVSPPVPFTDDVEGIPIMSVYWPIVHVWHNVHCEESHKNDWEDQPVVSVEVK